MRRYGPRQKMIFDGEKFEQLICRYVNGRKAERNREILREYYLRGYSYEEIAEHLDMSAIHVGRIVRKDGDPILLMMQK